MTIFHAIILGIVEGISEFLPISSTGHMILAGKLLNIPSTDFVKSFEIVIQLGAILAVVVLYWKKLLTEWGIMKKIATAFVPTAIVGYIFYKIIKYYLLGNSAVVVGALIVGGIALIVFELNHREKDVGVAEVGKIGYRQAVGIGLFQCLGMIPGVSRSAATIIGGLLLGLKRQTIVEFSFLLAVPTMLAATGYDLLKSGSSFSSADWLPLAVGFIVSFVVAIFSIKWLLRFIQKYSFIGFGVYRILAAIVFWLFIL
jgi:undecaprenyl-diphosphatase